MLNIFVGMFVGMLNCGNCSFRLNYSRSRGRGLKPEKRV